MVAVWLWAGVVWGMPVSIDEVANPRHRDGWVSDTARVLEPHEKGQLDVLLQRVHEETGAEVAVVTVEDTIDEPKAFATGLFNHWGLGDARANNGLLVLLVLDRRRLEMETGYGLEAVLPDGWLGSMQAQQMVPHFKGGDYGTGLVAGVEATAERLQANAEAVRKGSPAPPTARPASSTSSQMSTETQAMLAAGGLGTTGVLGFGGVLWWRRRQRTCPTCHVLMEMIPEHEDDEHLTEGEQFEEQIGSVDYQIYVCGTCTFSKMIRVAHWFTGYSSCPACGHRARTSVSSTIRSATYDHGGLVRVTETCSYCKDGRTFTRSTPRLQRSSSSSSSGGGYSGGGGGSSFGGGSSGGGGAGSSW